VDPEPLALMTGVLYYTLCSLEVPSTVPAGRKLGKPGLEMKERKPPALSGEMYVSLDSCHLSCSMKPRWAACLGGHGAPIGMHVLLLHCQHND
jgi:hypothetical protein